MVRVGDVQQELYLVNTDLTTLSALTEFLITSELDTLPNGLWQEHTVIQWSYPREKLVCHTWTRWQHEDKIIRCWHGYVGGSHPTKTSNVELTQIEKKAKPNANNETQCCLPSSKFNFTQADWFCIKFFDSFRGDTSYSLYATSHFKKPSYNFSCYKTIKKYGIINWMFEYYLNNSTYTFIYFRSCKWI